MHKSWYKRIGYAFVLMIAFIMLNGTKSYATEEIQLPVVVNPFYQENAEEIILELESLQGEELGASSDVVYTSIDEAAKYVRQQMVARNVSIVYKISNDLYEEYGSDVFSYIFDKATEHTEECSGQEGDALIFGMSGYIMNFKFTSDVIEITLKVSYYTTAAQEEALTTAVNSAMSSLNLSGKSDYEKVEAIYKYICDNVDYDHEHLGDSSYKLQYTAYAALVNKTSVCQGYAVLFYRMCKEADVPVRVIFGYGDGNQHTWNIVKVGKYYYNVDCTWDGQDKETRSDYFLKSDAEFGNHTRGVYMVNYDSEGFRNQYVMSSESYGADISAQQGLNITNLDYTYTTINDTTVTSTANGKPKLLIFFSTTCSNSQSIIRGLKDTTISNADIIAVECSRHTKDEVAAFATQYGGDNVQFCYDTTGSVNNLSLLKYIRAVKGSSISVITLPVVAYIDANNQLQYLTIGQQSGSGIRNNLIVYCGYEGELTLSTQSVSLVTGGTHDILVYIDGQRYNGESFTWSSSNTKVATVDEAGTITAKGAGSATITCTAKDGRKLTVAVTVKTKLTLSSSTVSLITGNSSTVTVYADGVKSSASNYTWTSSNTKVATVDTTGKITGVAAGSATITCKASDGRTLTVAVTVTEKANGLTYVNGKYIWYTDGVKDTSKTGLVPFDGQWFYIVKGEMSNFSGFVKYDGETFYVAAGRMVAEASGLVEYNGEWYFVASGRVVSEYTGLAEYNGAWFYVANGKMDTTKKGMVEYNGGLFYVGAGKIMKHVSGLAQDPVTGKWYFLSEGQVQKQHTGLALYDGKWFYVVKGEFANTYTGYVTYDGSKFYVVKGEVQS